jgi:glycosyltransferase involved in cell wall biosynthesis
VTRRVLMVAYYFPPLGGIGSLRASKFAEHLPDFGWDPTVLTPRLGTHYEDPDLSFPKDRVIRSRSLEFSRIGKRVINVGRGNGGTGDPPRGPKELVRSAAHRYLYRPDAQIGWYPGAVRAGLRALRNGAFDAVFSTSVPMTAHLIGRRLHRSTGLPWIAEFRDPWSERDALRDSARAARLERSVATTASQLVMTSPTWARSHAEKWGRPVTPILAGTVHVPVSTAPSELVVTHLGSFYPEMQDLSAVWSALRQVIDHGDLPPVRIRFIGEIPPPLREQLAQHDLIDRTEVTGYVSHEEALKLLSRSSVLLASGPRDGRESLWGWIPAKLLEYLSTDLPIIYMSHTPNDGADLLSRHPGCHVIASGDVEGTVEAISASHGERYSRDVEGLSWRARAGQLAAVLGRCS